VSTTKVTRRIRGRRRHVYEALLDPDAEMTITYSLRDSGSGTDLIGLHENLPPGVTPADNETGWNMSLEKLAGYVERGDHPYSPS
jgi:hypothetical protein